MIITLWKSQIWEEFKAYLGLVKVSKIGINEDEKWITIILKIENIFFLCLLSMLTDNNEQIKAAKSKGHDETREIQDGNLISTLKISIQNCKCSEQIGLILNVIVEFYDYSIFKLAKWGLKEQLKILRVVFLHFFLGLVQFKPCQSQGKVKIVSMQILRNFRRTNLFKDALIADGSWSSNCRKITHEPFN